MTFFQWHIYLNWALLSNQTSYLRLYVRSNSVLTGSTFTPGDFVIIFKYTDSFGCTRITISFRFNEPSSKISPGTVLNWIRTSAFRSFNAEIPIHVWYLLTETYFSFRGSLNGTPQNYTSVQEGNLRHKTLLVVWCNILGSKRGSENNVEYGILSDRN